MRGDDRRTRRMALARVTDEDQVEVPRMNDKRDRYVPERFESKTPDGNQRARTHDPCAIVGIPTFFLYSLKTHGISNGDTLEHNRS